ncbi:hypothetical protein ZIOFF_025958 [Zingiber officinale]|uniref:Uncharacterized protein n=1 Tax=Zingiber officinale TaxID=94328 RepID=A0A8J5H3C5_ZINOF|nr:hypothetical protein ZIOFF_025958 [Zingiber officinale]
MHYQFQCFVKFHHFWYLVGIWLGLGAKLAPKAKVAVSVDQAERRLLGKLNSKKKLSSENVENNTSVKENVSSEEDEPESRTRAFVKKRSIPLPATLQSTKKRR